MSWFLSATKVFFFLLQGPRRFGSVWMKQRGCECIVTERQ
nr:hypothetical protein [Sicyoidochytrium minutum DNA virus]